MPLFYDLPFVLGGSPPATDASPATPATKAAGDYATYQASLGHGPFQGPYGQAWLSAVGNTKDWLVARAKAAVKLRFPNYTPPDGLEEMGLERQIDRGATESDASFATRIQQAWETWKWGGTAYGILLALRAVGYTNVVIAQVLNRYFTLDSGGNFVYAKLPAGSWLMSGDPTFWSKFQVIFPQPLPASWVSGGVPAESSNEAQFVKQIVRKWAPAHMTNAGYIIVTAGGVWGYPATDTWGDGSTWGGDTAVTWSP